MYGLVMIVKDAAATLEACLESVRPLIGHWTVCDTGSTDGTPELVERLLVGIPGALFRDPWVNFGHNRSLALARASGTADWLLASDADMTWTFEDFAPDRAVEAYMVDMGGEGFSNRLPLVLRGDLPWRSIGPVHEYTALDRPYVQAPTDAVRINQPAGRDWTPEKGRWQLELLERDDSPRSRFYRAKTLDELGDPAAREAWDGVGVTAEEVYYARWRRAVLAPDWPTRMDELMAAWETRPVRLEALYDLVAGLNEHGQHHAAWALASVVTPPCNDSLFVHRWVWDYGLLFQRQIAGWWVGSPMFAAITDRLLTLELPPSIRSAVERNASLRAA